MRTLWVGFLPQAELILCLQRGGNVNRVGAGLRSPNTGRCRPPLPRAPERREQQAGRAQGGEDHCRAGIGWWRSKAYLLSLPLTSTSSDAGLRWHRWQSLLLGPVFLLSLNACRQPASGCRSAHRPCRCPAHKCSVVSTSRAGGSAETALRTFCHGSFLCSWTVHRAQSARGY